MIGLLKNERGIALAVITMLIAILASMTGAALLFSRMDLMISSNYKKGTGALYAADAGVSVALSQLEMNLANSERAIGPTTIGDYTYRSYLPDEGTDKTAKKLEYDCITVGNNQAIGTGYNPGGPGTGVRKYKIFIMGTGTLNSAARKIEALGEYGPAPCF